MPRVTLFRRGKRYYAKWRAPNGSYAKQSLQTEDKEQAQEIRDELQRALVNQEFSIQERADLTHEEAWSEYVALVRKKPRTIDTEKCFWDQFWAWSRLPTLRSVRRADVAAWQKHLIAQGNAPTTVNDKVRQVGTVWNWLIREEVYSGTSPFANRKRVPEGPRKVRFIPWEKLQELVSLAYDRWQAAETEAERRRQANDRSALAATRAETAKAMYLALILGAYGGLRKGEILAARWEHIDWEAETFEVHGTKSEGSSATLHLHPTLAAALRPYRQVGGHIVRPGKEDGAGYRFDFRAEWQELRTAAGLKGTRLHDLRHSFATRLQELGVPIQDIAVMMRHSNTQATQRYADLRAVKVKLGSLNATAE